jgi:type I restriction enzyme M protein
MLTGSLRNDIDKLWEKFWTGGITNPLTVIEQISYLMFARMLDMQESASERIATQNGKEFDNIFPFDKEGQLLRWKNFKNMAGTEMRKHLRDKVYPHFATIHLGESDIGEFMRDADMEIKNESVLVASVEMVERLPLTDSDIKGDIYEYLLSKLTTAGINGQFRTPRHIIDLMVEMLDIQPDEIICDPACGTAGFLARSMEYLQKKYSSPAGTYTDEEGIIHYSGDLLEPWREHINNQMFWGFDFDTTMLRVSAMNMLLHGVGSPNIHYQDSLNKNIKEHYPQHEQDAFDVVLANPPFKGSLDETSTNPDVLDIVKTRKTELLFVAHILRVLKLGGRAAVIVPDGVLFGSSKAHQQLRKTLIDENQLEGIISLPSGVFKPYAGVSTAILIFTKGGETEQVWFYDLKADGYSLDDKRTPIAANDLPDCLGQWSSYRQTCTTALDGGSAGNAGISSKNPASNFEDRTQQAFLVPAAEIRSNKYDLSINRYREIVYEEEQYDPPKEILKRLMDLENEIQQELKELEGML